MTVPSQGCQQTHITSISSTQKRFIHRRLTQHAILPGLAGSRHVTPLEAEAYCTGQTVALYRPKRMDRIEGT
jgi:hypothetical protein